jgi:hypothetical protein
MSQRERYYLTLKEGSTLMKKKIELSFTFEGGGVYYEYGEIKKVEGFQTMISHEWGPILHVF